MLIELAGVNYDYLSGTSFMIPALNDINLAIGDNEFITIIGPTGSGKTTLAQLLNGLLKPTSGVFRAYGIDSTTPVQADALRRKVGLVFQFPETQLFGETVSADVGFGPRNLGLQENEVEERVREVMDEVGLDYDVYRSRSPFELSGGEKRLVAIAGVVAMRPDVIILDEPTSGLDARGRRRISGLLKKMHSQGLTVITITHDLDEVIEMAERVIVLHEGRIVTDGRVDQVLSKPEQFINIGLGVPTVLRLHEALRSCGIDIQGHPVTLDETVQELLVALKEHKRR